MIPPILRYPPRIPAADSAAPKTPSPSSSILSNKKFLEINDVAPSPSPAAPAQTPPAPTNEPRPAASSSASSPHENQRFLEINGVYPESRAPSTLLKDQRFLEINGVYPESSAPPIPAEPPSPVSAAVVQLEEALDNRDAAHPGAREYLQPQVDIARDNLEVAIREEIDELEPRPPYFDSVTLQQQTETGQAIAARYADIPGIDAELQRAVNNVIVDIEVEDTLAYVNAAPTSDRSFERINDRFDGLSEAAQRRLLQESDVVNILDDAVTFVTEPLHDTDLEWPPTLRVEEATIRLENIVNETSNPDIAAELVLRASPALEEFVTVNMDENDFYAETTFLDGYSLGRLGRISDQLVGAGQQKEAIAALAEFTVNAIDSKYVSNALVPDTSDGTGLHLALEIVGLRDNDPNIDSGLLLNKVIENYGSYLEGPVAASIEEYSDHTQELNFYISAFPDDLPPEKLEAAIAEYIEDKGPEWQVRLEELQNEVATHGANALQQQELINNFSLTTDGHRQALTEAASTDEFAIAVSVASNSHPELLIDLDIDSAIGFVSGLQIGDSSVSLRRSLANAHVQGKVADAIGDIDLDDAATVTAARQAIRELGSENFAEALGVDLNSLETATGALEAILLSDEPIDPSEIEAVFKQYESELEGISAFAPNTPLGFAFRSLGLATSAQAAFASTSALIENPSLGTAVQAAVDDIAFAQTATEFATELGFVADDSLLATRFGSNATVGKLLGVAGLALGTVGVVQNLDNGDYLQAGVGAIGVGGSALALFGSASWAGPVGIGVAAFATVGSLGINQYRNVAESNQFTGEEARKFFAHAGFDADAARALADRSGEGFSPVPILIEYATSHDLTTQEAIEWINSLDKSDLDFLRDRLHHTLDGVDGQIEEFGETHESDEDVLSIAENFGFNFINEPRSVATVDWLLENRGIGLPS